MAPWENLLRRVAAKDLFLVTLLCVVVAAMTQTAKTMAVCSFAGLVASAYSTSITISGFHQNDNDHDQEQREAQDGPHRRVQNIMAGKCAIAFVTGGLVPLLAGAYYYITNEETKLLIIFTLFISKIASILILVKPCVVDRRYLIRMLAEPGYFWRRVFIVSILTHLVPLLGILIESTFNLPLYAYVAHVISLIAVFGSLLIGGASQGNALARLAGGWFCMGIIFGNIGLIVVFIKIGLLAA